MKMDIINILDNEVRAKYNPNNESYYFVGKDVALALGYHNHKDALKKRVDEEDKRKYKVETNRGLQEMTIINESGFYELIFSSKLPQAKKFKRWVKDVLHSVRINGYYATENFVQKAIDNPEWAIEVLKKIKQEQEVKGVANKGVAQQKIVSSFELAEKLNVNHRDIIESIEEILSHESIAKDFFYYDEGYKYYLMNRNGFILLTMSLSNNVAIDSKLKIITMFNIMENQIKKYQNVDRIEQAYTFIQHEEEKRLLLKG